MDWMEGVHLSQYAQQATDRQESNRVGQTLWNFYMYQIHYLRKVHADPHPGNFLVDDQGNLIAIDFGCIKAIPDEFYRPYFELAKEENIKNVEIFEQKLFDLEILLPTDSVAEKSFFFQIFHEMLSLFTEPLNQERFDFSDELFWGRIASLSEQFQKNNQLRKMNGNRGSKHFIYMNRTFFGLYNLLHDLKAEIVVNDYQKYLPNKS